jgi:hypothetical protein
MKRNIGTKLSIGLLAAIITIGGLITVVRARSNAAEAQVQKAQAAAAVAEARLSLLRR